MPHGFGTATIQRHDVPNVKGELHYIPEADMLICIAAKTGTTTLMNWLWRGMFNGLPR
jgi:hypothetical protein